MPEHDNATDVADAASAPPQIALGVVGLGSMGAPLARRLSEKGFNPQVADLNPQQIQVYAIEGDAYAAATPTALAHLCNVIVMAMPSDDVLRDAVTGPNGVIHALKPGAVVVDMGATDPETGAALGRALTSRGALWVEAVPIGTPRQAKSGALTVLAGGQSSALERVAPVLEAVAEKVIRIGPVGSAAMVKSLAGLLSAFSLAATTEALIVARRFGIDPAAAMSALEAAAPASCPPLSLPAEQILSPQPGFTYTLTRAIADIDRTCTVAGRNRVPVPMSAALREMCVAARLNLEGSDELTALVRWLEKVARTELTPAPSSRD
jgi:3-hydroxyisobutyrate dehydrogenase-like beta-hydroxyacid dehydrogenase